MLDLHLHTEASDGALNTKELLSACAQRDLTLISITDHNTVGAYEALSDPAVRACFSGKILPGCEYGAHFHGCGLEVLGYGVPLDQAERYLRTHYKPKEQVQAEELLRMIRAYREREFLFDEEQVLALRANRWDPRRTIFTELDLYPENVQRYFSPASHRNHKLFTREEVFNPQSPYFMPLETAPSLAEVCAFIQGAGGRAILAHPCAYTGTVQRQLEEMIEQTHLDGLEAYYMTHSDLERQDLLTLCQKHHLIFSAGSDFHNFGERSRVYGNLLGMQGFPAPVPEDCIRAWADPLPHL